MSREQALEIVFAYINGWVFWNGVLIKTLIPALAGNLGVDPTQIERERSLNALFRPSICTLPVLI